MYFKHLDRDCVLELLISEPATASGSAHQAAVPGCCHRLHNARELAAYNPQGEFGFYNEAVADALRFDLGALLTIEWEEADDQ